MDGHDLWNAVAQKSGILWGIDEGLIWFIVADSHDLYFLYEELVVYRVLSWVLSMSSVSSIFL